MDGLWFAVRCSGCLRVCSGLVMDQPYFLLGFEFVLAFVLGGFTCVF